MKRLVFLMLAGAVMVAGCGSTPEKKEINVQLMKNDPPMGCQMVGDIQSKGDDMNEAKAHLRQQAADKGGNYVRLDALSMAGGDAIAAGAAFRCQEPEPRGKPTEKSAEDPS